MKTLFLISVATSIFLPCHGQIEDSLRLSILRAIDLPRAAAELRSAGVPVDDVRAAIETARRRQMPAAETEEFFAESSRAIEEHGPIDNFGAFVQSQLDGGLRGRDLAAAIKAEHQRRGIGRGRKLDRPGEGRRGPDQGQDRPEARGRRDRAGSQADSGSLGGRDSSANGFDLIRCCSRARWILL